MARPDVLFVQETKAPVAMASDLLDEADLDGLVWAPVDHGRWGSAALVRGNRIRHVAISGFAGWVVGGEVLTEIGALHIYSVHLPPDGGSYIKAANRLLDGLQPILRGTPVLLGGDFNLTVGRRRADEVRQNRPSELDLLQRLEQDFGLLPAWGIAHPDRPLPQTLRWARDPEPPYHCDGIFLPMALTESVESVRVLADSPWTELSDHNPVLVDWRHLTERNES